MRRESPDSFKPRGLWHRSSNISESPVYVYHQKRRHGRIQGQTDLHGRYRHKITGARSSTPTDILEASLPTTWGLARR